MSPHTKDTLFLVWIVSTMLNTCRAKPVPLVSFSAFSFSGTGEMSNVLPSVGPNDPVNSLFSGWWMLSEGVVPNVASSN